MAGAAIQKLCFTGLVDSLSYPLGTSKPRQFLTLSRRHPHGNCYRVLSLLHRFAPLAPAGAAALILFAHSATAKDGPLTIILEPSLKV